MTTDRQLQILHHLVIHQEIEVDALSRLLNVSPSTVRRDLHMMEDRGLLVRLHGAARLPAPVRYLSPYESRAAQQMTEKRAIALAASRLVDPGMVLGLMGGTTCTEFARLLRPIEPLTVVTNAVNIALELQGQPHKQVIVTGGVLNHNSYELVGTQAISSLEKTNCDFAFLGASGVTAEYGVALSDEPEAAVGRALIAAGLRVAVLADSTKIGKRTFARLCPISQIDLLITDQNVPPEQLRALARAGLEVIAASPIGD